MLQARIGAAAAPRASAAAAAGARRAPLPPTQRVARPAAAPSSTNSSSSTTNSSSAMCSRPGINIGSSATTAAAAETARRAAAALAAAAVLLAAPVSGGGAALAAGGGLFDAADAASAPAPFTLYGTNQKLFSIETLDGEKVVSRSRGFTVDTCVSAVEERVESPEFQMLSAGERLRAGDNLLCRRATGPDLKPACATSCRAACSDALDAEAAKQQAETGLPLSPSDRKRLMRGCVRQCTYGCVGSGKTHDFVTTSRR